MVGWFPNNPCMGLARISNYFLAAAAAFDKDEIEGGMKHPHLYISLPPSLPLRRMTAAINGAIYLKVSPPNGRWEGAVSGTLSFLCLATSYARN